MPWSILQYPYVKAAILSTHKDDPCGSCNDTVVSNAQGAEPSYEDLKDFNNRINLVRKNIESIEESQSTSTTPITLLETENKTNNEDPTDSMQGDQPKYENEFEVISQGNKKFFGSNESFHSPAVEEILKWMEHTEIKRKGKEKGKGDKWKLNAKNNFLEYFENAKIPQNERIPLKIILKDPHKHRKGTNITFHEYVVLHADDPNYHGHMDEKFFTQNDLDKDLSNIYSSLTSAKDDDLFEKKIVDLVQDVPHLSYKLPSGSVSVSSTTNEKDVNLTSVAVSNNITPENTSIPSEEIIKLVAHYSKLLVWIFYPI